MKIRIGTHFIAVPVCLIALMGCGAKEQDPVLTGNHIDGRDTNVNRSIGNDTERYQVYGSEALTKLGATGIMAAPRSALAIELLKRVAEPESPSSVTTAPTASAPVTTTTSAVTVGFPLDLLGHQYVFGSVVTGVSDAKSETMGRLKLTDLTPIHVTPRVFKVSETDFVFALTGCVQKCEESSDDSILLTIPILGVDTKTSMVALDLSSIGKSLNLMEIIDPKGEYTQLTTVTSETVRADYSLSTLVFDIQVTMVPKADPTSSVKTTFTTRWYMRLLSSFDPSFVPRVATPGVGFFMTERAAVPKLERLKKPKAIAGVGNLESAHYYVKNVPTEYRPAFDAAFDAWNKLGQQLFGKPILSHEYVETSDPRHALLIPGDARYHILEWDINNVAPYGGLGPAMANQHTGEIFSSNVLIQGPTIVKLYTAWFAAAAKANELKAQGLLVEADQVLLEMRQQLATLAAQKTNSSIALTLGENLVFRVPAQDPSLEDPVAKLEFEIVPAGLTYSEYMKGYFREMVAHELGHNLGLRHNFRGNLSSTVTTDGNVSSSVMEYLGRGYRHLNRIGAYDEMAIRYGYSGTSPAVLNGFCTDEDVPTETNTKLSAECSRDDATGDPFSFFIERLERATVYLTAPGSKDAPVWTVKAMDTELAAILSNLGMYAANPSTVTSKWTGFFGKPGRPKNSSTVKSYVLRQLKNVVCSDDVLAALDEKSSNAARRQTLDNIQALSAKTSSVLTKMGAFTTAELECQE